MKIRQLVIASPLIVLSSCYLDAPPSQLSADIAAAKKAGVFAKEYRVVQEPQHLLPITDVWAEHIQWVNGGFFSKKITVDSSLHIVFNTDSTQQSVLKPSGIVAEYHLIDSVSDRYVGAEHGHLVFSDSGNIKDTICFSVRRKEDKQILGRIWLYKK